MNATLFGNEISRRFEKKATKIGRIYQGIGILTAGEGVVKGLDSASMFHERALEANGGTYEIQEGEGCEGLYKVFPPNAKKELYIGKNHEKPFTSSSIENMPQTSPKANVEHDQKEKQPFTNSSPGTPLPEGWEEFVL
jgi:hypothetical protein